MGSSLTWIAVQGTSGEEVAARLRLKGTGRAAGSERAAFRRSALPGGWHVIVADTAEDAIAREKCLAGLSAGTSVLAGFLEEHVMASRCEFWRHGMRQWRVDHRGEDSALDLSAEGQLPEAFASIRDAAFAMQREAGGASAGVDHVFEVPMALSRQVVGFRPDEDDQSRFEVLEGPGTRQLLRRSRRMRLLLVMVGALLAGGFAAGLLIEALKTLLGWLVTAR